MTNRSMDEFEEETGYKFQNKELLKIALTHSSYSNEKRMDKTQCNERLEFLGDAVLELVSSEFIFRNHPDMPEGEMTKTRASYVCEPTLALCAKDIHLGDYLRLGKGEERTGGRERDSVLSDALEATIGAVYMDGGFEPARQYIQEHILRDIDNKKLFYDSKTFLQEIVQSHEGNTLEYQLIGESGPDHHKEYQAAVFVNGRQISTGTGQTKKKAEQSAAYEAILILKREADGRKK
ncbi:MAG: ribonuclease III [Lachnospiraceae bacterium]|nr:ribonuclease III [Lachnospiraceae bacterium]